MRRLVPLLVVAACQRHTPPPPAATAAPTATVAPTPTVAVAPTPTPTPAAVAPRLVGSKACLECHAKKAPGWRHDWHSRAIAVATPETVVGKFANVHFAGTSTEAWLLRGNVVRTAGPGGALADLPVQYVIGGKRMQDPVTALPDGRWQVLPVYYHVTGRAWVDYTEQKQGRLGPEHPFFWANFRRTANHECLDCHATGVDVGYDPTSHRWSTRLTEPGLGCEACHGPGARHAETQEVADIVNPGKLPRDRALAVCGSCHGPRVPLFPILDRAHRFQPGDAYDDHYVALMVVDGALRSSDFFADGRPRTSSYELQALSQSRCHLGGAAGCLDCHDAPHDAKLADELRARPDETCRKCHAPVFAEGKAHTHHERAGCVDCHMPKTVTGVLDTFADHALDIPSPLNSVRHGIPNACNACHQHAAEKPEDTAAALARLWPAAAARQGRRLRLADALDEQTAAGSREPLEIVIADDKEAAVLRGAAAMLLAQRFPRAAVMALVPLLGDRDPLLRARAAEALGYSRSPAPDALAAATRDPSLTVREAATVSLEMLGDPRAEEAARRLTGDPASEGLPRPHRVLSLIHAARREFDASRVELERVVALVPYDADALVGLAGLSMQAGDKARARAYLEEALRFAPDSREARARLSALP